MVHLGNEPLGSGDETVVFLKIRTKRLGESLWFQGKFSEGSELWVDPSPAVLGKKATLANHNYWSLAVLTALTRTWLSGRELWERSGLALQAHVLLKQLHCAFFARGKMGTKPPLVALSAAQVQTGPLWERQLENWESLLKVFGF